MGVNSFTASLPSYFVLQVRVSVRVSIRRQGVPLHGMGKKQLRWEKEKKVVPLVEQSQEILAWLGKLSYQ